MRRSIAWSLAKKIANNIQALCSTGHFSVTELLLFGSLARKRRGEVGDVDLLILGQNSTTLHSYYDDGDVLNPPSSPNDWPEYYRCNGCCKQRMIHVLVFPTAMLIDQAIQNAITERQFDPRFLHNCFSAMHRYNWQ